jgi:glycosyltransferase involved in cell wall biosynthesis
LIMRISFVLPFIWFTGGMKAVFLFANRLKELNHEVSVIYPIIPLCSSRKGYDTITNLRRLKLTLRNLSSKVAADWFDLKADLIRVPFLSERYIPKADIIVATWWETAYYVNKYGADKGNKFYLAQHYEVWGGPKKMVDDSYRLGLKIIVNSRWLKNVLEKELNLKTEALILHAPDWNDFYPERVPNKKDKNRIRILMPFRGISWKGDEDGLKAFEIVKIRYPQVQFVMFGLLKKSGIPSYIEFNLKPSNSELRKIYNSCDIFVFPSRQEGFGMPPLEAMACKCAVATTNVGAVPDYTISGETALVSEPNDIEGLARNIIRLVENEGERKKIAEKGYEYTKQFTWERSTEQLVDIFNHSKIAQETR